MLLMRLRRPHHQSSGYSADAVTLLPYFNSSIASFLRMKASFMRFNLSITIDPSVKSATQFIYVICEH